MARLPTPEDAARHVLTVFAGRGARAGEVLQHRNFLGPFSHLPWRGSDFQAGAESAAEKGWIELLPSGSLKLTSAGFDEM